MTNKIVVRQLTKDDLPAIKGLLERRYTQLKNGNKHNRGDSVFEEQYKLYQDKYLAFEWDHDHLPNVANNGRSYGVFHQGELRVCITQLFSSRRIPSFNLANLVVDPCVNTIYEVCENGIAQAVDMAVEDAERHGYTQFSWVTALKGWNTREERWYNASRTFKRYNVFIDNIIPAGEKPKFEYEWNLVGWRTHPIAMAVKSAKIKPHLRHELFKSRGLLNVDYVPLQEDNTVPDLEENALVVDSKGVRRWRNGEWRILDGDYSAIPSTAEQRVEVQEFEPTIQLKDVTAMEQVDDWIEYTCREISYNEIMEYESYFFDHALPLANDYYDNHPNLNSAENHFYCAEHEGKPVAFTGLGLQPNINRIYHRSSLTLPNHSHHGAWTAVWNYKINEIIRNGWSQPDTVHYVLTKAEDTRYTKRGFKEYAKRIIEFAETVQEQTVWFTHWKDLLEHPKQKPFINV